jgi:hypothetical protein
MTPAMFIDDFERTEWGDGIYSILGRALSLAAHFESSCRSLAGILHLRVGPREVFESEELMKEFLKKLHDRPLKKYISQFAPSEDDFRCLMDKARYARNEIAHEIPVGMYDQSGLNHNEQYFLKRIRELSMILAEADRAVCFVLTEITNEHMPNNDFLKNYPDRVVKWVCEQDG